MARSQYILQYALAFRAPKHGGAATNSPLIVELAWIARFSDDNAAGTEHSTSSAVARDRGLGSARQALGVVHCTGT